MAANEIVFRVKVEKDGNLKVTAKEADAAAKSTKGLGKETDKLNKKRKNHQKVEKGVAQAGLSTAKGFSKQASSITGGLVPAYAILAANIFAITAAFNALKQAAQVEVLEKGFSRLGNVAGRTSSLMAKALKEVTDGAISTEDALKAAAAGFSAGFTIQEMEGLAEIARGASIALGRDLGDALDRLIRGTAKLEPEILDELGLFVRLDDAASDYAATLGKTAGELTDVQRRQAFLNAALEQGVRKFGLLADADVNVFNQVGATFRELAESFLQIVNVAIVPFMQLLAANVLILAAGVLLLARGIFQALAPGLFKMGEGAQLAANKLSAAVPALDAVSEKAIATSKALLGISNVKIGKGDMFSTLMGKAKGGSASKKELDQLTKMFNRSIAARMAGLNKLDAVRKKASDEVIKQLRVERDAVMAMSREYVAQASARAAAKAAQAAATAQQEVAASMKLISDGSLGLVGSFKAAGSASILYAKNLYKAEMAQLAVTGNLSRWAKWKTVLLVSFKSVTMAVRVLGVAFITFLPHIVAIMVVVGLLFALFKKFTKSADELKSPMNALNIIVDTMPDKFNQLNEAMELSNARMSSLSDSSEKAMERGFQLAAGYEVVNGILVESAGSVKELAEQLVKQDFGFLEKVGLNIKKWITDAILGAKQAWVDFKNEFPGLVRAMEGLGMVAAYAGKQLMNIIPSKESVEEFFTGLTDEQAAIQTMENELTTLFNTINEQNNNLATKLDLSLVFGKNVKTASQFTNQIILLDAAWRKANPNATYAEKVLRKYTQIMERARTASAELLNATKGLGEAFQASGKLIDKSFAKLRKPSEFQELSNSLADLQKRMKESSELFGGEGEGIRNDQFKALGAAFAKYGIDLDTMKDKGQESFNTLKVAIDAVIDAEMNAAANAKILGQTIKQAKLGETLRQTNREMSQLLTTYSKTGKLVVTQAQKSENITKDLKVQATLLDTEAANKKLILGFETQIMELKLKAAQIGLDKDSELFLNLQAQLDIIEKVRTAKEATIDAEVAGQKKLNKLKSLTSMGSAPSSANSEIRGAKGAGKRMGIFTDNLAAGTYDTDVSHLQDKDGNTIAGKEGEMKGIKIGDMRAKLEGFKAVQEEMMESMRQLGPEGALAASMGEGAMVIADSWMGVSQVFATSSSKMEKGAAIAGAVAQTIGQIAQIQAAASAARVAGIDKEIAAEKKRDGKSKASLAKIKALEAKKESEKRKAFETNKKMLMAQTVANTAAGIMSAVAKDGPLGIAMAILIGAMGAAQLAIISGTSYQGGASAGGASVPSSVSVGERSKSSDMSKSQSARGELAYFRGAEGMGGAENFRSAFYGKKHRAAGGNAGYVVGEQGPELFMPDRPGTIVPADDAAAGGGSTNVTFSINAIDAAGVEDVLAQQQGNIIGMIREAANSYGQDFMEELDESTYTTPIARRA